MNIVFLDVDGVLNSFAYMRSERYCEVGGVVGIDPLAVARLNTITTQADAQIVVTSTKRIGRTVGDMRSLLCSAGVTGRVRDVTPVLPGGEGTRSREIDQWLQAYTRWRGPCRFVVLDDSVVDVSSLPHIAARVVGTSMEDGLRDDHVVRTLALFLEV